MSGGRFTLGIGASGPQVIEGWHGVPYDAPIGRTREVIEICRKVWRRERLEYAGKYYTIPLPPEQGTGLGKPLKLINHPVRDRIPIMVAALGPKNVALAAELAEGWQPIFFYPEKAAVAWAEPLAAGRARRDPSLGPLDVMAAAPLAIGADVSGYLDLARPIFALYIGGMGPHRDKGHNFYYELAVRFGLRGGRRPDPGRVPGGPQGRSRRPGSRRIARGHVPDRAGGPGHRAARGDEGGRGDHAQRHPAGRQPRGAGPAHRADPRPDRLTGPTRTASHPAPFPGGPRSGAPLPPPAS